MKPKYILVITYLIILIFIIGIFPQSNAQDTYQRQLKYWYLRDRLRYFIATNEDPNYDPLQEDGSYMVMVIRNRNGSGNSFTEIADYGQESSLFGKYIGVLATESYLLRIYGYNQEADKTDQELIKALAAQKRRDLWEDHLGYPYFDVEDGLFVRHDVPINQNTQFPWGNQLIDAHPSLNTYAGLLIDQDQLRSVNGSTVTVLQANHIDAGLTPEYELMSQDEVIFTLEGLALAYHFGGTQYIKDYAQELAGKILLRCYGQYDILMGGFDWSIHSYDNNSHVPGGNCNGFSYGYSSVANYFQLPALLPNYNTWLYWFYDCYLGWNTSRNSHMVASLAAIGNYWGSSATQTAIFNSTDGDNNWKEYYLWLHEALQDYHHDKIDVTNVEARLDEAPCEGPWRKSESDHAAIGWCTPDRWYHTEVEQNGGGSDVGIFSGIDYMILLNLYYICNVAGCSSCGVPYQNMDNSTLDKYWPQGNEGSILQPLFVNSFRTITSSEKIHNNPLLGDVNYFAGESILLKPGFLVESGAVFRAKPVSLNYCPNGPYLKDFLLDRVNKVKQINPDLGSQNIQNLQSSLNVEKNLQEEKNVFIIYPNPTDEMINIKNNTLVGYEFLLQSLSGALILDEVFEPGTDNQVDISNLKPGVYFCRIISNNSVIIRKIIKK